MMMKITATKSFRSKYSKWRVLTLSLVYLLIGIHIAHWLIAGKTLAPLEISEVLYTIHLGIVTVGFIFMCLSVLGTLIFGRFFCGWGCHLLAIQDLSNWILKKAGIKPRPVKSRVLLLIPFIMMAYLFVWPQVIRLYSGQGLVHFRILSESQGWASFITDNLWRNLPGAGITILTFLICGFVMIYFLGSRSFCLHACPYGALFAITDRLAPGKIVLKGNCTGCGICTAHCNSHIAVHKEILQFGQVVDHNCIKDLDCVGVCPENAIGFGFKKPAFFKSMIFTAKNKTRYNLSIYEELVVAFFFIIYLLIYRNLYDAIPFLLALGIAITGAFITILFIRLIKNEFVRLNPLLLKSSGRWKNFGKVFAILFLLFAVFTIHSGFIRYYSYQGEKAFLKVAGKNHWLPGIFETKNPPDLTKTKVATYYLETAWKYSPVHPLSLQKRLAALYLLDHKEDKALPLLRHIIREHGGDMEALAAMGIVLANKGNFTQSEKFLAKCLLIDSLNAHLQCRMGDVMFKSGRAMEAIQYYEKAIAIDPGMGLAFLHLGMIYQNIGDQQNAVKCFERAVNLLPDNAGAHFGYGQALLKLGLRDKAQKQFDNAVSIDKRYSNLSYN